MRRRRATHLHVEERTNPTPNTVEGGDATSLRDDRPCYFTTSQSGIGLHDNGYFDTHSGSDSSSSSSSRSQTPSVSSYSTSPLVNSTTRGMHDTDMYAKALLDFEYELSCQLKPVSWTSDHSASNFPSPVSTSSSSYSYESPITSPTDRWHSWDTEMIGFFQEPVNRCRP
ncbi:hypothetical protein BDQ17DRAFT_1365280 [Cyathus striatus]|nr:hypothetical protein BDQ17DRAFT_1365280 [Cyathus striatus]